MFVWTSAGSQPASGHRSATASARRRARRWSSARRSTIVSSATSPAAARMPTWRMPPPRRLRSTRARAMRSAGPASSDPTGAPRPFDRQHVTVVAGAERSATVVPVATAALNRRAPSRWTGTPTAATAASRSSGHGRPPEARWVSSTHTTEGAGHRCAAASTRWATSPGSSVPSSSSRRCSWATWLTPKAPPSWITTCWRRPATTAVPGPASTRSAIWLAIVPDGTNTAAALPIMSAKRRSSAPHGRVVAEAVVADLGLGHGPAHRGRRAGDGVAAQVDRGGRGGPSGGRGAAGITPHRTDERNRRWSSGDMPDNCLRFGTVVAVPRPSSHAPPHPPPDPAALVALASGVAAQAVDLLLAGEARGRATVRSKSTGTDMVSEMDRASERLIVAGLLAARPDDGDPRRGGRRPGTGPAACAGWSTRSTAPRTTSTDSRAGACRSPPRMPTGSWRAWSSTRCATRCSPPPAAAGRSGTAPPIACADATDLATALVGTGFAYDAERRRRAGCRRRRVAPARARHPPARGRRRRPLLGGLRPPRRLLRAGPRLVGSRRGWPRRHRGGRRGCVPRPRSGRGRIGPRGRRLRSPLRWVSFCAL